MVIEIRKSKNEKYKDTLVISKLLPFEYAILSKTDFKEPLTGEGKYGTWSKYNIMVHEYKTTNPSTGEVKLEKPEIEVGWFASGVSLEPKLLQIEVGQKFKVTQVKAEGKSYSMYKVELIKDDGTLEVVRGQKSSSSTKNNTNTNNAPKSSPQVAPEQTLDEVITTMKKNGMLTPTNIMSIAEKFGTSISFIEKRAEVL